MRRTIVILIGLTLFLGSGGCRLHRWDFNWHTFRFERVGRRQTREQTVPPPARTDVAKPTPRADRPAVEAPEGKPVAYRLYLARDSSADTLPEEIVYDVKQAPVEKLAAVIQLLYPGKGPAGSTARQCIIYNDIDVWDAAKAMAGRLDAPTGDAVWHKALAELYETQFPRKLGPQKRLRIINMLNRLARSRLADPDIRWAAAIITSHLSSRYDPKDHPTAGAALAEADRAARRGSFRAMVVRYHLVRQLIARGSKVKAIRTARDAADAYTEFRGTLCYQTLLAARRPK